MFDFGARPPEINSGLIYAGPGSGPMMAAAAAWDEIAAEVATAASGYSSVMTELTSGPWVGPAASSMLKAVTPYVSWLGAMAAMAEDAASQGRAAAAAYEAAFSMTVPPPVIAANRVLLASLIATNFFGQNTPAIAVTEAQYAEMWAQDAAAMYGYAGASALAAALEPFPAPPNTTTPDATAEQAMAVSRATAEPAGSTAQTASQATAQLVTAAAPTQQLAAAATTNDPGPWTWLTSAIQNFLQSGLPTPSNNYLGLNATFYTTVFKQTSGLAYFSNGLANFGWSIAQQLTYGPGGETAGSAGAWFPTPQFATLGLGNLGGGGGLGQVGGGAAAAAGQAARVGMLSVPHQWTTLTSAVTPMVAESELSAVPAGATGAAGAAGADSPNALLRGVPMGGVGRRGATAGYVNKYGFRYSVLTRPPSAG